MRARWESGFLDPADLVFLARSLASNDVTNMKIDVVDEQPIWIGSRMF